MILYFTSSRFATKPFFPLVNPTDVVVIDDNDVDSHAANDSRNKTIKYTPMIDTTANTLMHHCSRFFVQNIDLVSIL